MGDENFIWMLLNRFSISNILNFQESWCIDTLHLSISSNLDKYHISYIDHTGIKKLHLRIYFVECVSKIKHILSVIHYTICGAVCFQFINFPCGDWENIYTLSYYHNQIGSMSYYPLIKLGHEAMVSAVCLSIFLGNYLFIFCRTKHFPQIQLCTHLSINTKLENIILTLQFWKWMHVFIAVISCKICIIMLLALKRESTNQLWIPITKASDTELWCVLWCSWDQNNGQTIETPVIWDAIIMKHFCILSYTFHHIIFCWVYRAQTCLLTNL